MSKCPILLSATAVFSFGENEQKLRVQSCELGCHDAQRVG